MNECLSPHTENGSVWCGASKPRTRVSRPYSRFNNWRIDIFDLPALTNQCALEIGEKVLPSDTELIAPAGDNSVLTAELVSSVVLQALRTIGRPVAN